MPRKGHGALAAGAGLPGAWIINLNPGGLLKIEADAKDAEACKRAAFELYLAIELYHGSAVANEIMVGPLRSKQNLKNQKNYELLTTALRRLRGAPKNETLEEYHAAQDKGFELVRSVEQVAAELVEENKTLPPDLRYGPSGNEYQTVSAMAKQIGRLLDEIGFPRPPRRKKKKND